MQRAKNDDAMMILDERKPPPLPEPMLSWLPRSKSDPTMTLLCLSTCTLNIDAACGLHEKEKQREYISAWSSPAPAHCSRPRATTEEHLPFIHSDRLGFYM